VTRARVTKLDEFQFLTCVKHGLWGSHSARFKDWRIGDKLIVLVDNALAGAADVSASPFVSSAPVWDNGEFPHRVPIQFTHVGLPEHRMPLLGDVRDTLVRAFDSDWGLGVLNQWLMKPDQAVHLTSLLRSTPNDLDVIIAGIDGLLAEAKATRTSTDSRASLSTRSRRSTQSNKSATPEADSDIEAVESDSEHHKSQAALIALGHIVGCSVWVASNDKGKTVNGKALGNECLATLPNMGLSPDATRAIGLIDVIWLRKNAPAAAFEVEATTSVYSGLLRLSDLVELVPALKLNLYIVAPKKRKGKVLRELARPTFRRIGLGDTCKFVAVEDLLSLVKQLTSFKGHVQPSILDTIAAASSESEMSGLT
jgi:hypothetical protein